MKKYSLVALRTICLLVQVSKESLSNKSLLVYWDKLNNLYGSGWICNTLQRNVNIL